MIERNIDTLRKLNAKIYKLREEVERIGSKIEDLAIEEDVYISEHELAEDEKETEILENLDESASITEEITDRLLDLTTYIESITEE